MKRCVLIPLCAVLIFISCASSQITPSFNYKNIIEREYEYGTGRVVPMTVEQSIEMEGHISSNGKNLYYASDRENGNYDLYLRNLDGITTSRLTEHPAKDFSPAISPDGKYLAFVSLREDPEGDIYVMKVNAKRILKRADSFAFRTQDAEAAAKNLTLYRDVTTGTIRIIKDYSPAWSPDGSTIAFSSARDGSVNIWAMNSKGKNLKKLTSLGGMYPQFSPDGKNIIFISYRDNPRSGDVYVLNLETGMETRITASSAIKFNPSFAGNSDEILYTSIHRDTNGDGRITLKDNSVIMHRSITEGMEYSLTSYDESSFDGKWFPVFGSEGYQGIIVFSTQVGENININIIPDIGIIPKMENARSQYEFAETIAVPEGDVGRYATALERVYCFFAHASGMQSKRYTGRSLLKALRCHEKTGSKDEAVRIKNIMASSSSRNSYTDLIYKNLVARKKLPDPDALFTIAFDSDTHEPDPGTAPFFLEECADRFLAEGKTAQAQELLEKIRTAYPGYERMTDITHKRALLIPLSIADTDLKEIEALFNSSDDYLKIRFINDFLAMIKSEKNMDTRISLLQRAAATYGSAGIMRSIIDYASAAAFFDMRDFLKSGEILKSLSAEPALPSLIAYKTRLLMGDISIEQKKYPEAARFYNDALSLYQPRYHDQSVNKKISWLVSYYENEGRRFESSGRFRDAVELYKKFIGLLSFINGKKGFESVYNSFGARAHIQFIDATFSWKGDKALPELLESYEKKLPNARLTFDRAFLLGLGYVYTKQAIALDSAITPDNAAIILPDVLGTFKKAVEQLDWAIFMDDAFIDPYILKSWIYTYVDMKRLENDGLFEKKINAYFPKHLWEQNISILNRALALNNETSDPEREGSLHLNIANCYYLLENYSRSLHHYGQALLFKKSFGSKIEEALFYFHLGYSHWQDGNVSRARKEMAKSYSIYNALASSGKSSRYGGQLAVLCKYFALFSRIDSDYKEAIAWYNRLLSFGSVKNIDVDRARCMQEIALCYRELGDRNRALSYLAAAEKLLESYTNDEKKYFVKIKFFEFGPFPLINIGPDRAVIGASKMFASLDTREKKILNCAMQEEIHAGYGDYTRAAKALEKKITLHRRRNLEIDREAIAKGLNNRGFYQFRQKNNTAALRSFKDAWDYSVKVKNQQGAYTAIINSVNLYAHMIDNNSAPANVIKKINSLLSDIFSFQARYRDETFNAELKNLKKTARAENRKLLPDEMNSLSERIREDAAEKNYSTDIAAGVLKYYLAEIYSRGASQRMAETLSLKEFSRNDGLVYGLYSEALERFNMAISRAEEKGMKMLHVKLLLNRGVCQSRLGGRDNAYASLIEARDIVRDSKLSDLRLSAFYRLADFCRLYGKDVEGNEYLSVAERYYEQGLELIEDNPLLYAGSRNIVDRLYEGYIAVCAAQGSSGKAFAAVERREQARTIYAVYFSAPEFSLKQDTHDYLTYLDHLNAIESLSGALDDARENAHSGRDETIRRIEKELSMSSEKLVTLTAAINKRSPILASYLFILHPPLPQSGDIVLHAFIDTDRMLSALTLYKGALSMKKIGMSDSIDAGKLVSDYINEYAKKGETRILFNETFLSIVENSAEKKQTFPPFTAITSVKNIGLTGKNAPILFKRGLYTGSGVQRELIQSGTIVDENPPDNPDFTRYQLIASDKNDKQITPAMIFRNEILSPSVFIKVLNSWNYDDIKLFAESAHYAGVSRTCFITDPGILPGLMASIGGTDSSPGMIGVIPFGQGQSPSGTASEKKSNTVQTEYALYEQAILKGKLPEARAHLNRWHDLDDFPDEAAYLYQSTLMNLINGGTASAREQLYKAETQFSMFPEIITTFRVLDIYSDFYFGNARQGIEKMERLGETLEQYQDYFIFKAIVSLINGNPDESFKYFSMSEKTDTKVLAANRLKFLYMEYFYVFNQGKITAEIMKNWKPDFPISNREYVKIILLTGVQPELFDAPPHLKQICAIQQSQNDPDALKNEIRRFPLELTDYTDYAPLILMNALQYFDNIDAAESSMPFFDSLSLNSRTIGNFWADSLPALSLLQKLYCDYNNYAGALSISNIRLEKLRAIGFEKPLSQAFYSHAEILARLGKFRDAIAALRNIPLNGPADDAPQVSSQLLKHTLNALMDSYQSLGEPMPAGQSPLSETDEQLVLDVIQLKRAVRQFVSTSPGVGIPLSQIEEHCFVILNRIAARPYILKRYCSDILTFGLLDQLIRIAVERGEVNASLRFAEAKKVLSSMALLPGKTAGLVDCDIHVIQRSIGNDELILCVSKVDSDIFLWFVRQDALQVRILKKGYPAAVSALEKYNQSLANFSDTNASSASLGKIFSPLSDDLGGVRRIYISADRELEPIPYEIIGPGSMLIDRYAIIYLASLPSLAPAASHGDKNITLIPGKDEDVGGCLGRIAAVESGMDYSQAPNAAGGICHITGKMIFDMRKGDFFLEDKPYGEQVNGPWLVFIGSIFFSAAGYADAARYGAAHNAYGVIVNDTRVKETNSAKLIELFYREIRSGGDVISAFEKGVAAIRVEGEFRHPSYWEGIRLYLNSLE